MAVPAHEIGHITEIGVNERKAVVLDDVVHGIGILVETVQMTFAAESGHYLA